MKVKATTEAVSYVLQRGGQLYLWAKAFGRAWEKDETTTEMPPDVEFARVSRRSFPIEVYVDRRLERPDELRLELRRLPSHDLKVHWGDVVWGARGEGAGGG